VTISTRVRLRVADASAACGWTMERTSCAAPHAGCPRHLYTRTIAPADYQLVTGELSRDASLMTPRGACSGARQGRRRTFNGGIAPHQVVMVGGRGFNPADTKCRITVPAAIRNALVA
jgi:hypothetical protein